MRSARGRLSPGPTEGPREGAYQPALLLVASAPWHELAAVDRAVGSGPGRDHRLTVVVSPKQGALPTFLVERSPAIARPRQPRMLPSVATCALLLGWAVLNLVMPPRTAWMWFVAFAVFPVGASAA